MRVKQDALRANEDLSRVKKDVLRVSSEADIEIICCEDVLRVG